MRAETSVPINEVIATRRSPRSFDSSHTLADADLRAGLEAARWAPSAFNGQPWRFYAGLRGDDLFSELHDRGLVTHQMAGYSKELARTALDMPTELVPVVVIAVGKQDVAEKLPESLAAREVAPRERLPLEKLVIKGL